MVAPPRRPLGRGGGLSSSSSSSSASSASRVSTSPRTTTVLAWALLAVFAATAQSRSVSLQQSIDNLPPAGSSPPEIPLLNHQVPSAKFRSTDDETANSPQNSKFDALAPAAASSGTAAVRAPVAPQPDEFADEAVLSLSSARLLRNWEAENIVLLATIDGAIHARDRASGDSRWSLGIPNSPMIQTLHHCHNRTHAKAQAHDQAHDQAHNQEAHGDDKDRAEDPSCEHEYIFIVEPSKDGMIYIQHRDPRIGLKRLGVTVKDLALDTPGFVEEPPLVTIAQTVTTAYVVDAATGTIISQFNGQSAGGSSSNSCRRLSGLELDDPACDPIGTINLGRIEYTVEVSHKITMERLCTIRFAEWIPNKQDIDLQDQYLSPLEDTPHIQTYHNGKIQALRPNPVGDTGGNWWRDMGAPVARVFDVVRPVDRGPELGELKVLSRPLNSPLLNSAQYWGNDLLRMEKVFVNRTEAGFWYALSELAYPGVTAGAKPVTPFFPYDQTINLEEDLDNIIGVHVLTDDPLNPNVPLTIEGRPRLNVADADAPEQQDLDRAVPRRYDGPLTPPVAFSSASSSLVALTNVIAVAILVFLLGLRFRMSAAMKLSNWLRLKGVDLTLTEPNVQSSDTTATATTTATAQEAEDNNGPVVDAASTVVVAEKTDGQPQVAKLDAEAPQLVTALPPTEPSPRQEDKSPEEGDNGSDGADSDDENEAALATGSQLATGPSPSKKPRTKRGQRGGKKNRKKKKQMEPEAIEASQNISNEDHPEPGITTVGRLRISTREDACLGRGSNGTIVFPGMMDDGRLVAVKRLQRHSSALAAKEIKHLLSSDENPHVVRYFGKEESHNFIYIALDLFRTSLDRFVERPGDFPELINMELAQGFDVKDCLSQVTEGLAYLHSLKLVHRDIKPQNVLVKQVKTSRPTPGLPKLNFVISDFGLCKPLEEGPESAFAATANHTAAGTTGWRAPELLVSMSTADFRCASPVATAAMATATATAAAVHSSSHSATHSVDGSVVEPTTGRRATKAIDIFSLGCVFYYVMTQGRHPFDVGGTSLGRDLNIKEANFSTQDLRDLFDYSYDAEDLVMRMIQRDPKRRPDTAAILKHPFFWNDEKKLDFICAVSDAYEKEKNSVSDIHKANAVRTAAELASLEELAALERLAPNVILRGDFLRELPRSFLAEMGKQRKYTGSKMIDLLRAIRNKRNHFLDLPDDVKEMMLGGSVSGYWLFWEKRFKNLLINCHSILIERDLITRFKMDRFY